MKDAALGNVNSYVSTKYVLSYYNSTELGLGPPSPGSAETTDPLNANAVINIKIAKNFFIYKHLLIPLQ